MQSHFQCAELRWGWTAGHNVNDSLMPPHKSHARSGYLCWGLLLRHLGHVRAVGSLVVSTQFVSGRRKSQKYLYEHPLAVKTTHDDLYYRFISQFPSFIFAIKALHNLFSRQLCTLPNNHLSLSLWCPEREPSLICECLAGSVTLVLARALLYDNVHSQHSSFPSTCNLKHKCEISLCMTYLSMQQPLHHHLNDTIKYCNPLICCNRKTLPLFILLPCLHEAI